MDKYLLTIAIPTYNRKNELAIALNSVISQIQPLVEVIVSDNCSDDGTERFMLDYCRDHQLVNYIRTEENIGSSNNFMRCFKEARGKYVLLLCDDDLLCQGSVSKIIEFLGNNRDLRLVYLNQVFFRDRFLSEETCTEPYLSINKDVITKDKNLFIKQAGMRITYTSSLIFEKSAVLAVNNPEQYFKSRFLSASLAMMSTSGDCSIGIIAKPCIAANLPSKVTNYNGFKLFGINVKRVLCETGDKAGYDPQTMNSIYKDYVLGAYIKGIANAKINKQKGLWNDFFEYLWPAVREYAGKRELLFIAMLVPGFVWKPIRDYYSRKKYGN